MTHKLTDNQGRPKLDQAIENVLKELEKKELEIKVNTSNLALLNDNNNKLKQELETYKKIAEFLAKNSVVRAKCERCVEDLNEDGCARCTIDWARKEVEKDAKN